MNTREELLVGLSEASNIIRQLANIQERLNATRAKYQNLIPQKKVNRILIIVISVIGLIPLNILLPFIIGGIFLINNLKNKKIEEENQQRLASNEQVKIEEQNVLNELQEIQNIYNQRVSPWYPIDYCSVDAVEFLYNAITNYRADTLKEAINLYETTLHQRRVEDNQKQAIRQQQLSNLLNAGSLILQGAQLGATYSQTDAINSQTASINRQADSLGKQTDSLNKINETLNRIRRGF